MYENGHLRVAVFYVFYLAVPASLVSPKRAPCPERLGG
jgi:hypothetical protein